MKTEDIKAIYFDPTKKRGEPHIYGTDGETSRPLEQEELDAFLTPEGGSLEDFFLEAFAN